MKSKYIHIREDSLRICTGLTEEELSIQPRAEVSPAKWHLGHTTWFFEKIILEEYSENYKLFNKDYNFVFNSYYKQVGKHLSQTDRGELKIDSTEILKYREYVDKEMQSLFNSNPEKDVLDLIDIGLNHEQQHQELLHMDIKSSLFSLDKGFVSKLVIPAEEKKSWLEIPEGLIECGNSGNTFCFDNEKPCHKYYQYKSSISETLVTNVEFEEFLKSGGYSNSKYWLSKGWEWLEENNITEPLYWSESLNPLAAVAHISYFEADAYANWVGCRLPTEYEHEYFDNKNKTKNNLWSWTSSQYSAYPRYRKFDGTLFEYNGKFMCNQFVLRGGCIATPDKHWRESYRNFYEPNQRWMFSGIRLAKDNF